MILNRVTFTGADDSINPETLIPISEAYPHVEWGILFRSDPASTTYSYVPRFPSYDWVQKLNPLPASMNFCAHLCGVPVVQLLLNGEHFLTSRFKRSQLNFHGENVSNFFPNAKTHLANVLDEWGGQFIFQCDGVNDHMVMDWVASGLGVPLFDTSSGAGVTPGQLGETWPQLWPDTYCGYAGGLGPHNLPAELTGPIAQAAGDGTIWIDMETKVFTRSKFDLDKCLDVLEKVAPYVQG